MRIVGDHHEGRCERVLGELTRGNSSKITPYAAPARGRHLRLADSQVSDAAVNRVPPLLSPLAVARVLPVIATPD